MVDTLPTNRLHIVNLVNAYFLPSQSLISAARQDSRHVLAVLDVHPPIPACCTGVDPAHSAILGSIISCCWLHAVSAWSANRHTHTHIHTQAGHSLIPPRSLGEKGRGNLISELVPAHN